VLAAVENIDAYVEVLFDVMNGSMARLQLSLIINEFRQAFALILLFLIVLNL